MRRSIYHLTDRDMIKEVISISAKDIDWIKTKQDLADLCWEQETSIESDFIKYKLSIDNISDILIYVWRRIVWRSWGVVYYIQNNENGKRYIWQSRMPKCRVDTHDYLLRAWKHFNKHLQEEWNRYLIPDFCFWILGFEKDRKKREELERHFIETSNPDMIYNINK